VSSKPVLITITGPTCSGKSTFAKSLKRELGIAEVRSFTTRPQRAGEVDGIDYDFLSQATVVNLQCQGLVAESVQFPGGIYGSTIDQVQAAMNASTFLRDTPVASIVVEPKGVEQFEVTAKRMGFDVFSIYVGAPAPVLIERFLNRFKSDEKADASNYTRRLLNLLNNEIGQWYQEINWHFDVQLIDDAKAWSTTDYWIENFHIAFTEWLKRRG
jgi:guanylate kinase